MALVIGMHTVNLAAFLIGGVIAGIGAGVLFKAAIGLVAAVAAPPSKPRPSPGCS